MKDKILNILKQNPDKFVSGQAISAQLGITRAAVWKHMEQLRHEGYGIESVSRRGYRLSVCADILTESEIRDILQTHAIGQKIIHFQSLDSTNNKAKELAEQGEPEGTVVVTEMQTGGRGCTGRSWESKPLLGIWMSVILRPALDMPSVPRMTEMASAAVGQALETITDDIRVKWPNDVLVSGKKICGILTESSGEIDRVNYVVLGIGVNVNQKATDFPSALAERATSLRIITGRNYPRKQLFCTILESFERMYLSSGNENGSENARAYCKSRSCTLGQPVTVLINGRKQHGTATDLNERGGLIVRLENGEIQNIASGRQVSMEI